MANFQNVEKEAFLFAQDLFSDIISLHPMFRVCLPEYSPKPTKSSHFTRAVSKSVMVIWHELRNDLKLKLRRDFDSFSKDDAALKVYLEDLCDILRKIPTCKIRQVLDLSAILLEVIAFLYERTYTDFFKKAPIYWLLMFKNIAFDEFYKAGGWKGLSALSKKLEIYYDNNEDEIYCKYFDLMPGSGIGAASAFIAKAELDIVSKDKIETDFESETPSKDPVIPKIPEQTKQFFEKMTPEDKKALDSKEQEGKMAISESRETLLEKKDAENISPRPEDSSKKATVSESESSISRSSSAETDKKFSISHVVKKEPDSNPKSSKLITPKEDSSKIKSDSIPSTAPKNQDCQTSTAPKRGSTRSTSMQSSQKAVNTSAKAAKSDQALPVEQGATSTETSASGQNVSEDEDLSTFTVITVEELDTVSKDEIGTDFESDSPSKDPMCSFL